MNSARLKEVRYGRAKYRNEDGFKIDWKETVSRVIRRENRRRVCTVVTFAMGVFRDIRRTTLERPWIIGDESFLESNFVSASRVFSSHHFRNFFLSCNELVSPAFFNRKSNEEIAKLN